MSERAMTEQTALPAEHPESKATRLHYLDWLQVLAILGVFTFHAVHPFDELSDWMVKNDDSGDATMWATGSLDARVAGSGSVRYYGDPQTSFSGAGSGRIKRVGGK
jgi:hypothetical protein